MSELYFYNSLTRMNERFAAAHGREDKLVTMYVCGPTVYGPAHIGHGRCSVTFDIINRYLRFCGYKVKFVRNYTDVGHLEFDSDTGEDKIQKQAKKDGVDPLEIVQKYINSYRIDMEALNVLPPSVEPQATTFITEQIELISEIINNGFGYVVNGSVYFDVLKYNSQFKSYGNLSGRNVEELFSETRDLNNQNEKKNNCDFALWKKADSKHIMHWPSPWSEGYPGWHTECVAISQKILGEEIDIHGGGMDLQFPHHEAEIAQAYAARGKKLARFWIHNNLVNINGNKMSKSMNNFITLHDLFYNSNNIFSETFDPLVLRFLFLQTHYRSTLSINKDALLAAKKGYCKLLNAYNSLYRIEKIFIENGKEMNQESTNDISGKIKELIENCFEALNNDLSTPRVIANLFELSAIINDLESGNKDLADIGKEGFNYLKNMFTVIYTDILGFKPLYFTLKDELILKLYKNAKNRKDYTEVDFIRSELKKENLRIADFHASSVLKFDF